MEENNQSPPGKKEPEVAEKKEEVSGGGGGWGGWGISPFSVLSDLQKAAAVAAEEITRNAAAMAKSIGEDMQSSADTEPLKEGDESDDPTPAEDTDDDDDKRRKSALDKLEKASEDSLLGQGLKVLDSSVENFASGAWQAFGNAWKGGSQFVHKLESSAANIAESIQHTSLPATPGSVAPSLIESGKALTSKGIQVLERVGKETMDLLITETGMEVDKNPEAEQQADEEQLFEEVSFDRCFYIYGGPEQLEELEALSSHYTLLFNRRKAKLSAEQKSFYEGKLKQVQQIFSLSTEGDDNGADSDKGKKVETVEGSGDEMKSLRDASVSKAADMAAGFATSLAGIAANEIIQLTAGRLEGIHSEGVHRLSELCCSAVTQLFMLGKSIISSASKAQNEETEQEDIKIEWPEDSVERAKLIRSKAQSMAGDVELVSNSFITGISDVVEAYQAAIKGATANAHDGLPQTSVQEKADAISDHLHADQATALDKIQEGLQFLAFVVISSSMPSA
ncbi:hypothetical protein MKX03_033475 [Papaver bracteatum]|nr:hypothetical protein MKX03_033475 [Papaver bracteatum]